MAGNGAADKAGRQTHTEKRRGSFYKSFHLVSKVNSPSSTVLMNTKINIMTAITSFLCYRYYIFMHKTF
jgi:hypothetical protein